jgi:hypothetical protein
MDRRDLLRLGVMTLAAAPLASRALAQGAPAAPTGPAFSLDAYSRNLQWNRTPQDLAKAVVDLGLHSVDLTIGRYPAHVDAAKVKSDLPAFVSGLGAAGVAVRTVTTEITGADFPGAEAILQAIAAAGVGSYTWGPVAYDDNLAYAAQVEALKARFARLAKLNAKYKLKGLYQPRAGMAGSLFVDLLPVMQGLDPRHMAIRYDTAALLQARPENVTRHLHLGAPYIGAVAINDAAVNLEFPKWEQGHFVDAPELLTRPNGGGDNTGDAGGDWLAYGGGGRPLPYHYHPMPVGTGMIDLMALGKTLKDIGFSGPAECQVAYPLGGVETGSDKITLPRQEVIGRIKRDRITVEHAFREPWGLKVALPPFLQRREARPDGGPASGEGPGR